MHLTMYLSLSPLNPSKLHVPQSSFLCLCLHSLLLPFNHSLVLSWFIVHSIFLSFLYLHSFSLLGPLLNCLFIPFIFLKPILNSISVLLLSLSLSILPYLSYFQSTLNLFYFSQYSTFVSLSLFNNSSLSLSIVKVILLPISILTSLSIDLPPLSLSILTGQIQTRLFTVVGRRYDDTTCTKLKVFFISLPRHSKRKTKAVRINNIHRRGWVE